MRNQYYQLFNHAYSFTNSTVNSGGTTYSLPQNDYGAYGRQVDAFFNTMTNSAGGTGNLAVWFVSDKGLTYYTHSLGATAAITAFVESRFPVTPSSVGRGLIDLRGSPDWSRIVGDGVAGPTRASDASVSGSSSTQYVNGVKAVFGVLKNQYPNIKWAIAGLPYIPYQLAVAPPVGQSPTWDKSLTNNGGYTTPAWWDPEHPVGSSGAAFYDWTTAPNELKAFYEKIVTDGIQESVFDNCSVDWICPDIRVPYSDSLPFYGHGYDPSANYERNRRLCELAYQKAENLLIQSYPLISPMYPSREPNRYDDPNGFVYAAASPITYSGQTANSSDWYYPSFTYRYDMIQAAIDGSMHGLVFYDPMPNMVSMACTADITGGTGYAAQLRARNMFSSMMYGGVYSDGYVPSGSGYTDPSTKAELLRYTSKRTIGYLDDIRESMNIAGYGEQDAGHRNGWLRGASDPRSTPVTFTPFESSNTEASDSVYGEQEWSQSVMGGADCICPIDCEDTENPYRTQGGMACCCLTVVQNGIPSDACPCPSVTVNFSPKYTPDEDTPCNDYIECPCEDPVIVDLTTVGIQECEEGVCRRNISVSNGCYCVEHNLPPGSLSTCPPVGPCITCQCAIAIPPVVILDTCSQFGPPQGSLRLIDESDDYGFIVDMRNYKRSAPQTKALILYRRGGDAYMNWHSIYGGIIDDTSYAAFVRASQTILNPPLAVGAIRTQSSKEVLRHLPNQYFST